MSDFASGSVCGSGHPCCEWWVFQRTSCGEAEEVYKVDLSNTKWAVKDCERPPGDQIDQVPQAKLT